MYRKLLLCVRKSRKKRWRWRMYLRHLGHYIAKVQKPIDMIIDVHCKLGLYSLNVYLTDHLADNMSSFETRWQLYGFRLSYLTCTITARTGRHWETLVPGAEDSECVDKHGVMRGCAQYVVPRIKSSRIAVNDDHLPENGLYLMKVWGKISLDFLSRFLNGSRGGGL